MLLKGRKINGLSWGRVFVTIGQSHGHRDFSDVFGTDIETLGRNGLDETGLSIVFVISLEITKYLDVGPQP